MEGQPNRFRLRRSQRIRDAAVFKAAFDEAHPQVGRFMVLRVLRQAGRESRLGIIVSRRTFRRAVDRNRARRLLREAFRLEQGTWGAGMALIVIGRQAILGAPLEQVRRELRRLVGRAADRSDCEKNQA